MKDEIEQGREEVSKKILDLFMQGLSHDDKADVDLQTKLSDINIDSIFLVEFLLDVENSFNISFDSYERIVESYDTVGSLIECLADMVDEILK